MIDFKPKQPTATSELKDNSNRAKLVFVIFFGVIIVNLVAIFFNIIHISLLSSNQYYDEFVEMQIESININRFLILVHYIGINITAAIIFLRWIYRSYANLHALKPGLLDHEKGMAVYGFLIPILNLFKPFQVINEIMTELKEEVSKQVPEHKSVTKFHTIIFWWVFFLIAMIVNSLALNIVTNSHTIGDMIISDLFLITSSILFIAAAAITIFMVHQISKDETQLYRKLRPLFK